MKMMKQVSNRSAIFAPAVQSVRSTVALSCFLIQILLLCNFGRGHSAPGGGYINPSMYGSHQNTIQQQWPTQQEQLQQNQYYDTDQYQQQQHQQQPFEGSTGAVEPCVPPPLPPGWSEHIDPSSGRPYYYNSNDGSTSWDRPPPLPSVNETSADNDGTHQQQYDTTQSFPPSAQEHSNSTDSQEELSRPDSGNTDMIDPPYQKNPTSSIEQAIPPSSDGDALTSISRDENKIIEEEHWRETQGWNVPTERTDDSHKRNADVESDTSKIQQSQGWNLPPMQNRGWGISEPPPSRSEGAPTNLEEQQQILQTRNVDPYRTSEATFPTPNQAHQHQNHQLYDGSKTTPESGIPSSTGLPNSSNSPNLPRIGTDRANGNPVPPNHQHRGPESNLPINQVSPPPASIDGRNPHRGSQHQAIQQDSPRYIQQPPTSSSRPPQLQGNPYQYSQQRPGVTENQPYPPHQGGYGQPPQHQDGGQYRQTQQYPGRPMYNSYPPSTQQSYSSQAGGQLIAQEQQNLVKESLGRTWQSILGLKDKTKEVVETATSTVAQSAREATQTIAEKGTGTLLVVNCGVIYVFYLYKVLTYATRALCRLVGTSKKRYRLGF
jgi:hypothetical protein